MADLPANQPDATQQDMDSFVASFTDGIDTGAPDATQVEDGTNQATPPASTEAGPADGTAPESPEPKPDDTNPTPPAPKAGEADGKPQSVEDILNPTNKAFAEMRVENKELKELLSLAAPLLGANSKDPAAMKEAVKKFVDGEAARKLKVDPATIEALRQGDAAKAELEATQLKHEAQSGFEKLKQAHGLTNEQMIAFAGKLQAQGINPFVTRGIDLQKEYRALTYDDAVKAAREAGRQEEIARRTKAQTQAPTVQGRTGATNDTGESINTVDQLRSFLESK